MKTAAPAIFAAHLMVAERLIAEVAIRLAAARQAYEVNGMADPAQLAADLRDAERMAWSSIDDMNNAGCIAEKVRCDREDAKYAAFIGRAA